MSEAVRHGIGVVGYPGAGKSTAARLLAERANAVRVETGWLVRNGACEHFCCGEDDLSSEQLGEYSTMRRDTDGGDYVAREVIDTLDGADEFPDRPAVVCGIRDSEALDALREYFDRFEIVWVHTPFDVRLERLTGRARDGEDGFDRETLAERDAREAMWGLPELTFHANHKIRNDDTVRTLDVRLGSVAKTSRLITEYVVAQ